MEFLTKNLKKVDLIGVPVKLTFKGSSTVKTAWGGLLSLLLSVVMGFVVFSMIIDLFSRDSPIVRQSSKLEDSPQVNLTEYPVAVYFTDFTGKDITQNEVFNQGVEISADLFYMNKGETTTYDNKIYNVGLKRCTTNTLGIYGEYILTQVTDVGILWCLDTENITNKFTQQKENPDLIIRSEFTAIGSVHVSFNLHTCDETKNPGCFQKLKQLGLFYMGIGLVDTYLDLSDFADPIKPFLDYNSHPVTTNFSLRRYFSLRINELTDDANLFFSSTETTFFVSKGSERLSVDTYNPIARHLYSMVLDVSRIKLSTTRKYSKMQDLVASLGGLLKAGLTFAQIFAHHFSNYTLLEGIDKHLKLKQVNLANPGQSEQVQRIQLKPNSSQSNIVNPDSALPHEKIAESEFSFFNYLNSLLSSKRVPTFYKRRKEMEETMDILFIAERLKPVEQT